MTATRRVRTGVLLAASAVVLAACGNDAPEASATLTVFAAASLTEAFEQVAADFEAEHDGVEVQLGLAGSSSLAAQIQQGARADVFAAADTATMDRLAADGLVSTPHPFATNTLEIAVPPGNPAGISALQDLAAPGLRLVVCAAQVPCGAATAAVVDHAGLDLRPLSEEQSVTDVLGKVTSGEADAGIVWVTDVARGGDLVEGVAFGEAATAVTTYPIATVHRPGQSADQAELAATFVDAVLTDRSQATLAGLGFAAPPATTETAPAGAAPSGSTP